MTVAGSGDPTGWRPDQLAALSSALAVLISNHPPIESALLGTPDGFLVAGESMDPDSTGRMAAMAGSLNALADAVSSELALGTAQHLVIECDLGRLLFRAIDTPAGPLILALQANLALEAAALGPIAERLAAQLVFDLSDD